jgi:AraC-like DNA-binding protein
MADVAGPRTAGGERSTQMITSLRVDSELGSWILTEYKPPAHDPLDNALERIWLFDGTTALPRERVFPDATLEIVLQLDAQYRPVRQRVAEPFPPLSLGGIRTTAMTIEGPGRRVRVLGIRLKPTGAVALLRTSLRPLTDLDIDLHDVMGSAAEELGERCAESATDARCVAAAVEWARARIARAPEPAKLVVQALRQIETAGGDIAIARLDALCGTSRRRFAAAFQDHAGVTPKRFARIVRFRRALKLVQGSAASLISIAAQAGYYDQPHMNAEFGVHAGMTPQALRHARCYPNSNNLAVHFFQDNTRASA